MTKVLVTVGTTEFDELLQRLDSHTFKSILKNFHCSRLIIQRGRGVYQFHDLVSQQTDECSSVTEDGLEVDVFRFHPDLSELIRQVDLVISHVGAGTVLEVASARKLFLAVVNPTLQDNHQEELAKAIVSMGSSKCSIAKLDDIFTPLMQLVQNNESQGFIGDDVLFPILDANNFNGVISDLFCFHN